MVPSVTYEYLSTDAIAKSHRREQPLALCLPVASQALDAIRTTQWMRQRFGIGDLVVVCQSEGEQDYCFLGGWSILGLLRGLREWFQSLRVVG
jgi:hypothetical protein